MRNLGRTFPAPRRGETGTVALDAVDLDVAVGAFTSVLGPSGSGKTTLLRCIAGFEAPDTGTISMLGKELYSAGVNVRAHARGVGVVPQDGALFPHLNVRQNIGFGLPGTTRSEREGRVQQLLDLVGLTGLGGRRPHELSGGQQQRVALARALAPEPRLILLDEPFSALDAKLRVELREEVRAVLQRLGTTVVLVTHDQAEAMAMADHLVVMRQGRIVADGSPREVYEAPVDVDLGRFLGDALVLPGRTRREADGLRVSCALGDLEVGEQHRVEGDCEVLVRPEQLTVARDRPDGATRHTVSGVVVSESYFGHDVLVRVALVDSGLEIAVRDSAHAHYFAGETVRVGVTRPVSTYVTNEPIVRQS